MNQSDKSKSGVDSPSQTASGTSRRAFIQAGALATAGFFIVPRHVLGGKGFIAPSDKLNIAGVGFGGKGFSDTNNSYNNGANNIVALCDVDWGLPRVKENFTKHPNAKRYKDFREMLDKEGKTIDAVTVSTADHTHAVVAMAAMSRGKHVYVQKPLTHNIYEARMLTEAARKYKVVTQMGNQGASNPQQKTMVEWFDKGMLGTVHTVHLWTNRPVWPQGIPVPAAADQTPVDLDWDLWLGPAQKVGYTPAYHPFKWRGWWNFGAGALGDIGCHIMDVPFRVLGLGYPSEVETSVGQVFLKDWVAEYIPEGCPPSSVVELKFPASAKNKSAVHMTWQDGGLRPFRPEWLPEGEAFPENGSSGMFMIGDKALLACGLYGDDPKLYTKSGEKIVAPPKPKPADGKPLPENGHQVLWTEACKAGFNSKEHKELTSSFDFSGPLTESVLMGNLAIRSYMLRAPGSEGRNANFIGRKKLLWDGKNMKITNFDEANQFVKRVYRDGWSLTA
ncbi:Gfo/Idh/MocA family oxidoreductase [Spirosoma sp. BT702]|uniref:Gfo/Idh/MocA family oxidoreductase n=1 Tax=Spirosoma profusum TaxID=2771354 RepID=A0A926XWN3_9BACT|nr:Gfo/Idh/MocA family oxidoreductase [Spirosoma profusum]MBD2702007.1 Gfo/Idh/MocA family oxidoreductase [Spirosoma profusum]